MGKTSDGLSRSPQFPQFLQSRFAKYGCGLLTLASVVLPGYGAMAQTATLQPTIPDTFDAAFYSNRSSFFGNGQFGGTVSALIGIPRFPENQIDRDGRRVDRLYREVLEQQVASDPTVRTPDLPNPFSGSLLTTPLIAAEEPIPPAPPPVVIQQPNFVPAPAPAPVPARPIPALW